METKYIIPVNINKRFEFFPGMGWMELALIVGLGGVGVLISLLLGLVITSPLRFIPAALLAAIGFFLAKPQEGTTTGFNLLIYIVEFFKAQKIYLYERRI